MTRSAAATLEAQLRHYYALVESACADVPFDLSVRHPCTGRPSIAWCLGHLEWCVRTVPPFLDAPGAGPLPDEEADHGHPEYGVASPADWQDLRNRFGHSAAASLRALAHLDDSGLARPPGRPVHRAFRASLSTRERFLHGHLFHVAYHAGQIGLLRAALGLSWPVSEG